MPDVRVLTEELEQTKNRAQAILTEYKDGLTAEKKVEFTTLVNKATRLSGEIQAERQLDESKVELQKATDFLEKPQYRVPRAITPDQDGRKALTGAGWELKADGWHAPTSLGSTVALYPDEVLFGELPADDADASDYFRKTRASFQPVYRTAYGRFIKLAAKHRNESMAYSLLTPDEQKALSEGTDTAGGFLVPPDIQAEMLVRVAQRAVMRKHARVVNTSRDLLRWPAVAPNATSGSLYSSGFVGGWVGETPAFSDTDPAFQLFDIPIRKIRVVTKLSNDFVSDSVVNVLAFLAQNGAENMALVEDDGFINGDGTSLKPIGILNSGVATVDVEGSTSDTISNTSSATGSAPKLIALAYAVPAQYAGQGSWLMRRSIEGKVRVLVDGQNRYLWPPMAGSAFAAAPRELLGGGIDNSDLMPADGTNGNKVVVFGDLSQYIIAQRAQITSVVLRERFADTDQVGIVLFERVGGGLWNTDALRIGIV